MAPLHESAKDFCNYSTNIPRVSATELLTQIRDEHTERLEHQIMVFAELLYQRQRGFADRNGSNCHFACVLIKLVWGLNVSYLYRCPGAQRIE